MPKGPTLIDLTPKLGGDRQNIISSARDRYGNLAVSIFDDQERDYEIFKKQCFCYIKEGNLENLNDVIGTLKKKRKDVSLNFKDETTGNTPIIVAATSNCKKIAKLLLQQGVDVTLRNKENKTAIELSSSKDLTSLIISDTASIDLKHASWQGNIEAVKDILKTNVNVNAQNDEGMTPLSLATRDINLFEKLEVVKNYHPLKVVRTLLKNNADASVDDNEGKNAFHHLFCNVGLTTKEILKVLLASTTLKVDGCNSAYISPLHVACKMGDCEIVKIILNNGGDLETKTRNGKTPLHFAVSLGHLQLSELLVRHGADPTVLDASGNSPLDIAKKMKNKSLLRILEEGRKIPDVVKKSKKEKNRNSCKVFFDGIECIQIKEERNPRPKTLEIDRYVSPIPISNSDEDVSLISPIRQPGSNDMVRLPALQSASRESTKSPMKLKRSQSSDLFFQKSSKGMEARNWFEGKGKARSLSDNEELSLRHNRETAFPLESISDTAEYMQGRCSPRKLPSLDIPTYSVCSPQLARMSPLKALNEASLFQDPVNDVFEESYLPEFAARNDVTGNKNGRKFPSIAANEKQRGFIQNGFGKLLSLESEDGVDNVVSPDSSPSESPKKTGNCEPKRKGKKSKTKLPIVREMEIASENVVELMEEYSEAGTCPADELCGLKESTMVNWPKHNFCGQDRFDNQRVTNPDEERNLIITKNSDKLPVTSDEDTSNNQKHGTLPVISDEDRFEKQKVLKSVISRNELNSKRDGPNNQNDDNNDKKSGIVVVNFNIDGSDNRKTHKSSSNSGFFGKKDVGRQRNEISGKKPSKKLCAVSDLDSEKSDETGSDELVQKPKIFLQPDSKVGGFHKSSKIIKTKMICGDVCEKKKICKQNEDFVRKIKEGKVREDIVTIVVEESEDFPGEKKKKGCDMRYGHIKSSCQEGTRRRVSAKCSRIEVPAIRKASAKKNIRKNEEKGKQKSNMLTKNKKQKRKKLLSVLPGFENCLSDDAFRDMVFGKTLEKHLRYKGVKEAIVEDMEKELGSSSCVREQANSLGLNSNQNLGHTVNEDSDGEHDAQEQEILSDILQDDKYRSLFDFYTGSSSDGEKCNPGPAQDVRGNTPSPNNIQFILNDDDSVERGNITHSNTRNSVDPITVVRKFEPRTVKTPLTGRSRDVMFGGKRENSNVEELFPIRSSQDDIFKQMTEIMFARGIGNSASCSGSERAQSREFTGQFPTSQRNSIFESFKRSSISTQTSEDSEFGDEDLHEWQKGSVLGKGAYGTVYLALTNRGRMVAVKQVEISQSPSKEAEKQYKKLQEEIQMLKYLSHRYIVKFIGTSMENNVVNIFMEHIPGGSLAHVLKRFGPLNERIFKRYTRQIVSGVVYIHGNGIVHRDIKGANIMLSSGGVVKLIDFGCAKRLNLSLTLSSQSSSSCKGTPFWMAPEVIRGEGNDFKSDIWSIGCTVFEMATGKPPWSGTPCAAMFAIASDKTEIPSLPEQFTEESRDFVQSCLTRDSSYRPAAEDLQKHRFIAKRSVLSK